MCDLPHVGFYRSCFILLKHSLSTKQTTLILKHALIKRLLFCVLLLLFGVAVFAQNEMEYSFKGSSSIKGVVYAKDNSAPIMGMAPVNINPKQFTPKGTVVVLMPCDDYFTNRIAANRSNKKEGKPLEPIKDEAKNNVFDTEVYNDKGAFRFGNIADGKYWLISYFGYTGVKSSTQIVGHRDSYNAYGSYPGSAPIEQIFHYYKGDAAYIEKVVELAGDETKVVLKRADSLW